MYTLGYKFLDCLISVFILYKYFLGIISTQLPKVPHYMEGREGREETSTDQFFVSFFFCIGIDLL